MSCAIVPVVTVFVPKLANKYTLNALHHRFQCIPIIFTVAQKPSR